MSLDPSRRAFMAAAGAVAVGAVMPARAAADNAIDYRTAGDLLKALASGRVSSRELVDSAIARIEALDSKINAVVVRDFDGARAAAAAADATLARGDRQSLLGLPITVKESFNVAGLPTSMGEPKFKDRRPTADTLAVERLKAAGAVILGKTNLPLGARDWQSFNEVYGTTNNPWDLSRTPGGSSGGSAAALAAGYVSLELGADIGGSLRCPAHFCGVFSHKTSLDLIPYRGSGPLPMPIPLRGDLAVIGPMARCAADLSLLLDVIAGPDPIEAGKAYRLELPPPRHSKLADFRVLLIDSDPLLPTDNDVRSGIERFADHLGKAGASVARTSPLWPDFADASRLYMRMLLSLLGANFQTEAYTNAQTGAAQLPGDNMSLRAERLRGAVLSHRDWVTADNGRVRLKAQWRELFNSFDAVICPIMPTPAYVQDHSPEQEKRRIRIDGIDYPYTDQLAWPGVATLPGLPATAIPTGFSPQGLPIGVQIVGPWLEDRTPLKLAELIEREFGGFVPPPMFND